MDDYIGELRAQLVAAAGRERAAWPRRFAVRLLMRFSICSGDGGGGAGEDDRSPRQPARRKFDCG
jgi:hypothetical protein